MGVCYAYRLTWANGFTIKSMYGVDFSVGERRIVLARKMGNSIFFRCSFVVFCEGLLWRVLIHFVAGASMGFFARTNGPIEDVGRAFPYGVFASAFRGRASYLLGFRFIGRWGVASFMFLG